LKDTKKRYIEATVYLAVTVLIGLTAKLLSLDKIEDAAVSGLQSVAQKTVGITSFSVLTYLGDFYLWVGFSVAFLFYTYIRSRRSMDARLTASVELAMYLVLITASTALLKMAFARPRPSGTGIIVYDNENSFAYPSGHVSRAAGSLLMLQGKKSTVKITIAGVVLFAVSLSRIALGAHFPTDTVGAVFLSLAMHRITEATASPLLRAFNKRHM